MKATVFITRRPDISDPQGAAVLRGVRDLGYTAVESVRVDKVVTLRLDIEDGEQARAEIEEMCEKLLANPVMEDYEIVLDPEDSP